MSATFESLHAFDRHSADYARSWGGHPLARNLRARVLAACAQSFPERGAILDLGCGPGLDAAVLTGLGHTVTAIDGSAGMVAEARLRAPDVRRLPIERMAELGPAVFDGALSDFGALNCLADLAPFGRDLAALLRPGARAVLVVMGRRCLAEDLALLARGRRPRRRDGPVALEGLAVQVRYFTTDEVVRALPAFALVRREALGALVAPPDLGGRPGLRTRLEPLVAAWPGVRDAGDHQLLVFERR